MGKNKLNGGRGNGGGGVDLREVAAMARAGFRANGYLNHVAVYNDLYGQYGSAIFAKVGLLKMVAAILEEAYCPPELLRVILSRWFEDRALIRAGYRDLVDEQY